MKHKIACCKITMLGSKCLILGHCRYDDEEEFWLKYQLFTAEDLPHYQPNEYFTQEACDKQNNEFLVYAAKLAKFQGKTLHFESINKTLEIFEDKHEFSLGNAKAVEITKEEADLLNKELNAQYWQEFDIETWGK